MPAIKDEAHIINIHWTSAHEWANAVELTQSNPGYVFYQIYGAHPVFGSDVLLYIGRAKRIIKEREKEQGWWVLHEEYDPVKVRLGSMGLWFDWDHWLTDESDVYPAPDGELLKLAIDTEKLLVLANQPVFNNIDRKTRILENDIRIFNTGHMGRILPEISSLYFLNR